MILLHVAPPPGSTLPPHAALPLGRSVPTPWHGRFSDYAWRDDMRIPLAGEVEWVLPTGPQTCWRGRIRGVSFE